MGRKDTGLMLTLFNDDGWSSWKYPKEERVAMIKTRPEQALDQEWVILMNIAKEMGLNKEEVRSFLQRNKNLPPVSIPKRRAIDR